MIFGVDYFGYVYIWYDSKRRMFYVGSHYGKVEDSYVCSSEYMMKAYLKRPADFTMRVLDYLFHDDRSSLLALEQKWLDMIDDCELTTSQNITEGTARYYNMKKYAAGGSQKGHTKKRIAPQWNKGKTSLTDRRVKNNGLKISSSLKGRQLSDEHRRALKRSKKLRSKSCNVCKTEFETYTDAKYCSNKCRYSCPEYRQKIAESVSRTRSATGQRR